MAKIKTFNLIKIISTFCATIIGAGIFILPYVALKVGFMEMVIYFLLLTIPVIVIHRLLAKVVWETEGVHSVPDYAGQYLGPKLRNFVTFISGTQVVGVLLAYILLGGVFLQYLLNPYFGGSAIFYVVLFFVISSLLIYKKIGASESVKRDFFMLAFSFAILLFFIAKALPFFEVGNFSDGAGFEDMALPFGVILFSLWGLHTVPSLKKLVQDAGGGMEEYKKVINWGVFVSALFYIIFIIVIVGVSGQATSQDALSGFMDAVGGNLVKIGLIFAILTILDSFVALGSGLQEFFHRDAKLSATLSWAFACLLPFSLFFMNFRDYVSIISIVGAFLIAAEGIIIVKIYKQFSKTVLQKNPPLYIYLPAVFFVMMLIIEFWYFVLK